MRARLLASALLACFAAPLLAGDGGASGGASAFTATAVYDPASLAAASQRCDDVTVTGITTAGGAIVANPGTDPAAQCVIASVRVNGANTVRICWRNALDAVSSCDTASSTWTFTQAQ